MIVYSYSYDALSSGQNLLAPLASYVYDDRHELRRGAQHLRYQWRTHGNRYYDPEVGRYLTRDPISYASGTLNIYAYVGNNPVNEIDPHGLIIGWLLRTLSPRPQTGTGILLRAAAAQVQTEAKIDDSGTKQGASIGVKVGEARWQAENNHDRHYGEGIEVSVSGPEAKGEVKWDLATGKVEADVGFKACEASATGTIRTPLVNVKVSGSVHGPGVGVEGGVGPGGAKAGFTAGMAGGSVGVELEPGQAVRDIQETLEEGGRGYAETMRRAPIETGGGGRRFLREMEEEERKERDRQRGSGGTN